MVIKVILRVSDKDKENTQCFLSVSIMDSMRWWRPQEVAYGLACNASSMWVVSRGALSSNSLHLGADWSCGQERLCTMHYEAGEPGALWGS